MIILMTNKNSLLLNKITASRTTVILGETLKETNIAGEDTKINLQTSEKRMRNNHDQEWNTKKRVQSKEPVHLSTRPKIKVLSKMLIRLTCKHHNRKKLTPVLKKRRLNRSLIETTSGSRIKTMMLRTGSALPVRASSRKYITLLVTNKIRSNKSKRLRSRSKLSMEVI